jgi:hypothetical protein
LHGILYKSQSAAQYALISISTALLCALPAYNTASTAWIPPSAT